MRMGMLSKLYRCSRQETLQ